MRQKAFLVTNRFGLTARGVAAFVNGVKGTKSEIWVEKDAERKDGKSVLDLLALRGMSYGSRVTITVQGEDEEAVMRRICELNDSDFSPEER